MKAEELKKLSDQDLISKLTVERERLAKLTLTNVIAELENPVQIKYQRRFIAKLLTEVSARAIDLNGK
jgi:large subunit ribosomal protein L29|tara:strand:- start:14706 stop:14909 length:204 start_codon:yes stop_codon:yes gene_type:complete